MTLTEMHSYLGKLKQQRKYSSIEQQIDLDIAIGELEAAIQIEEEEDYDYSEMDHSSDC